MMVTILGLIIVAIGIGAGFFRTASLGRFFTSGTLLVVSLSLALLLRIPTISDNWLDPL